MVQTQREPFEREARETVEELLVMYDVPQQVRVHVERLQEEERYIEALDVLVRNR